MDRLKALAGGAAKSSELDGEALKVKPRNAPNTRKGKTKEDNNGDGRNYKSHSTGYRLGLLAELCHYPKVEYERIVILTTEIHGKG